MPRRSSWPPRAVHAWDSGCTPSAIRAAWRTRFLSGLRGGEGEARLLQTTAAISPGSSGGGLFDDEGRLLGLTSFAARDGGNLNFAVPAEFLAELPARAKAALEARAREPAGNDRRAANVGGAGGVGGGVLTQPLRAGDADKLTSARSTVVYRVDRVVDPPKRFPPEERRPWKRARQTTLFKEKLMTKTFSAKPADVVHEWFVIDATDKVLGRVASEVALRLRGKHKAIYTPHVDTGDFIVIINAAQLRVTGAKPLDKIYYRHSGYPGGITATNFRDMQAKHPGRALEKAVKGMLPKGPLGYAMIKKLKVYGGAEHPHTAQQPKVLEL
jgi:large subunit ribosomal protein L13